MRRREKRKEGRGRAYKGEDKGERERESLRQSGCRKEREKIEDERRQFSQRQGCPLKSQCQSRQPHAKQ